MRHAAPWLGFFGLVVELLGFYAAAGAGVGWFGGSAHGALERWGQSDRRSRLVYSSYSRSVAMQTRVQKWGNSLGVRIPRGLAEEVGLGAGTEVSLSAKDGELVVRPAVPARLSLGDLLAGVTESNLHSAVDTGSAVGAEIF